MARSALKFDDATYAALLGAARDADAAHPHNNPAFLDAFLADAWKAAHRIYGAQTYLRFMAQAGVTRRPSAGTVQKAIVRARSIYETPLAPAFGALPATGGSVWAQQLEQNLARAMTLLDAMPESHNALGDGVADVADAMRRVQHLERENLELRARLAQMTVAAAYAREALGETLTVFAPHALQQASSLSRHGV
ncbi:hypothetical protein PCA31118_00974 [Pandoraea captiosa]|jgi:hypothetical protein|uniref:Uncharacterized protein n=1 Tax=Pandoraea captiosa TaxID=2508302 RepID=A0A5E4ZMV5_9BURK|nr:hypothetical protein [Pandoraea captiosa]VVE62326.1 hypothetical protein PCA31118_00974 [Pandoraea captiosa]